MKRLALLAGLLGLLSVGAATASAAQIYDNSANATGTGYPSYRVHVQGTANNNHYNAQAWLATNGGGVSYTGGNTYFTFSSTPYTVHINGLGGNGHGDCYYLNPFGYYQVYSQLYNRDTHLAGPIFEDVFSYSYSQLCP